MPEEPAPLVAPPPAALLEALDSDSWAVLLRHVRGALHDLDDTQVTAAVRRLRAAPAGRLAGGRMRRELCRLLAGGGPPWAATVERLRAADDLPEPLRALRDGQPLAPIHPSPDPPRRDQAPVDDSRRQELDRTRERLRAAREERDTLRRRLEGAERRAEQLGDELARTRAELTEARAALDRSREELAAAASERSRAVERERRRREAEVAELRDELAELRRAEEARRVERRRREAARAQSERDARQREEERRRQARTGGRARVVPGRPSRLPEGVVPGTAEAADALLHPGRLVLVDGYNLTLQHRGHLDLETQRTWLVQLLATLVARRKVRPIVVFDGERAGGGFPTTGARGVEVRFSPSGITADDEVVLAVEGTDEPVVVVTDDRELSARVRASGADVVGTAPFLWAAGS